MPFMEIISVYSDSHLTCTNKLRGRNSKLFFHNNCSLRGQESVSVVKLG